MSKQDNKYPVFFVILNKYNMQSQFLAAINQICDEKNIPKDKVIETIKAALRAAYRKDWGNKDQNVDVELNDSGSFATIFLIAILLLFLNS